MIRMSKGPGDDTLHSIIIVAFERTNGCVVGTFVHGSHHRPDPAGIKRSRDRFLNELMGGPAGATDLDVVEIPLQELEGTWIERIDPSTRKVVKRAHVESIIDRP
jgi:hypothetical protein